MGIGAMLEQSDHVFAYFSRALTKAEKQYSVIQQECLAAVVAMKQFWHHLLGCHFTLIMDHAPLQWLSAQKMEGLLAHWALAMQEYNYSIVYRTGSSNSNADALSRCPILNNIKSTPVAITSTRINNTLQQAQQEDSIMQQIYKALSASTGKLTDQCWRRSPLLHYYQLWHQLSIMDGVVCHTYKPDPGMDQVTVLLLPFSQRQDTFRLCHDVPSTGHRGVDKTLKQVQQEAYWVG